MNKYILAIAFLCLLSLLYACEDIIVPNIDDERVSLLVPPDSLATAESEVTFSWEEVEGADDYHLQLVRPSFQNILDFVLDTLVADTRYTAALPVGDFEWRVRAENSASTTNYSKRRLSIAANLASDSLKLTFPPNDYISIEDILTFQWTPLADANYYVLQLSTSTFFSNSEGIETTNNSHTIETALKQNQRYYWRVLAQNELSTNVSPVFTFLVDETYDLSVQNVELLLPPHQSTLTDTTVAFEWTPISGAEKYLLEVNSSDNFNLNTFDVFYDTLSTTLQSLTLEAGTYIWHVKALNANTTSPFSETYSFEVLGDDNLLEGDIVLLNQPNPDTILTAFPVSLQWFPLSEATSYQVQVASELGAFEINPLINQTVTGQTTYEIPSSALQQGRYKWRVTAYNDFGSSEASETRFFTYNPSFDLSEKSVILIRPLNGLNTSNTTLLLEWEALPFAKSYVVRILQEGTIPIEEEVTTPYLEQSFANGTYTWKVYAQNSLGSSALSETRSFTIDESLNIEEQIVVLTLPEDNSIVIDQVQRLTWQPIEKAAEYVLELASPDFSLYPNNIIDISTLTAPKNFEDVILANAGKYQWRVKAQNTDGSTAFSAPFTFHYNPSFNLNTQIVTLTHPAPNQILNDGSLQFRWQALQNAETYQFELQDASGLPIVSGEEGTTTATNFNIELSNGTYQWSVTARNSLSESQTASRTFTINSSLDISNEIVELYAPRNDSIVTKQAVELKWKTLSNADRYVVQYAKPDFEFAGNIIDEIETSNTFTTLSTTLTLGEYQWRVKAVNNTSNTETAFSEPFRFTFNPNYDLSTQQLQLEVPVDNAISTQSTITFRWKSLPFASNYELQIFDSQGLLLNNLPSVDQLTNTQHQISLSPDVYDWRVRAVNDFSKSQFSEMRQLTINPDEDISNETVNLVHPLAGEIIPKLDNIEFRWEILENADFYTLEIVSPSFSSPSLIIPPKEELNITSIVSLPTQGTYQWRVTAHNENSNTSAISNIVTFEVNTAFDLSSQTVKLHLPENERLYISNGANVRFEWFALDNATTYELFFYELDVMGNPGNEQILPLNPIEVGSTGRLFDEKSFAMGSYEWTIKASNASSETSLSATEHRIFHIEPELDLSNQTLALLNPTDATIFIEASIPLEWESIAGASDYLVEVAINNFNNPSNLRASKTIEAPVVTWNFQPNVEETGIYVWRVKARNQTSNTETPFSSSRTFVYDPSYNISNQAVVLLNPQDDYLHTGGNLTLEWTKLDKASSYTLNLVFENNPAKTFAVMPSQGSSVLYTLSANEVGVEGTYQWWVIAENEVVGTSLPSNTRTFEVSPNLDISNQVVTLASPANNATWTESSVVLQWNEVANTDKYRVELVSPTFQNSGNYNIFEETTELTATLPLDPNVNNYQWRVRGYNESTDTWTQTTSEWTWTFFFNPTADLSNQVVSLISPMTNTQFLQSSTTFKWNTLEGADSYQLVVKDSDGLVVANPNNLTSNTHTVNANLLPPDNYTWYVLAFNEASSTQSQIPNSPFSFTILGEEYNLANQSLQLVNPSNNATLTYNDVLLQWSVLEGKVVTQYTLEIAEPNFLLDGTPTVYTTNNNAFEVGLPDGEYEWRVKASNSLSETPYSAKFAFSINGGLDLSNTTVNLLAPTNNFFTTDINFNLQWEAVMEATTYTLWLKNTSTGNISIFDNLNTTIVSASDLNLTSALYEWKVKAVNDFGESPYSETRSFTYSPESDISNAMVELYAPVDSTVLENENVSFQWFPVENATSYQLQVTEDNFTIFGNFVINEVILLEDLDNFTYSTALPEGEYFWRVKALNEYSESLYSKEWYFAIQIPVVPPVAPTPIAPENESKIALGNVTLDWESAEGVVSDSLFLHFESIDNPPMLATSIEGDTFYEVNIAAEGTYFWRLKSYDEEGNESEFSEVFEFLAAE